MSKVVEGKFDEWTTITGTIFMGDKATCDAHTNGVNKQIKEGTMPPLTIGRELIPKDDCRYDKCETVRIGQGHATVVTWSVKSSYIARIEELSGVSLKE